MINDNNISSHRVVTIFLSSPGDVDLERQSVNDAVAKLQTIFSRYEVIPTVWQYTVGAVPGVGTDAQVVVDRSLPAEYDIYVGIMCSRFGTPTKRAVSGTIEEFQAAINRFAKTGKPQIFFYFCSDPKISDNPEQAAQLHAVREFTASYPGLYFQYASPDDLQQKFLLHLTSVLLTDVANRNSQPESVVPADRAWAANLYLHLQSELKTSSSPLISAERVRRSLNQLFKLIGPTSSAMTLNHDLLIVCAYLKTMRQANPKMQLDDLRKLEMIPVDLIVPGWEMTTVSLQGYMEQIDTDMPDNEPQEIPVLLELGELLSLDTGLVSLKPSESPMLNNQGIDYWLAYMTEEIDIAGNGLVTFRLRYSDDKLKEPLKGATAYRLERFFQHYRRTLTLSGVALTLAPCEVTERPRIGAIPDSIVQDINILNAKVRAQVSPALHLGRNPEQSSDDKLLSSQQDLPASQVQAHELLPLPDSVIRDKITVYLDMDRVTHPHRIVILDDKDEIILAQDIFPGADGLVNLNVSGMSASTVYRWQILWDDGTGFGYEELYTGHFRKLDAAGCAMLDVVGSNSDAQAIAAYAKLGLLQDLLETLWKFAFQPHGASEFQLQLHSLLQDTLQRVSYEWPTSPRLELLRDCINRLWLTLTTNVSESRAT